MIAGDHGLVVVSTPRGDGTVASSVVNAGVLPHPVTGETVVGMVIRGGTRKLDRLRKHPYANVVARSGWDWAAAEGRVELAGPDDPMPGVDAERVRLLLREIFTAAGGTHEDFGTYDRGDAPREADRGPGVSRACLLQSRTVTGRGGLR